MTTRNFYSVQPFTSLEVRTISANFQAFWNKFAYVRINPFRRYQERGCPRVYCATIKFQKLQEFEFYDPNGILTVNPSEYIYGT